MEGYYKTNFALMQYHKYSLTEVENLMPWEREVYTSLLLQYIEEEKQKQEALREVNQLRNTFAKHDLDNLALSKPKLIEKIVNKGTKKVKEELIALTDPDQFEEENEEDTSNN